jgi:hypothetical protein
MSDLTARSGHHGRRGVVYAVTRLRRVCCLAGVISPLSPLSHRPSLKGALTGLARADQPSELGK